MATHELKSWPRFFQAIAAGERLHELRFNDRNFTVGDRVILHEYDPDRGSYTGNTCSGEITSITSAAIDCAVSSEALHPGYCIFSFKLFCP